MLFQNKDFESTPRLLAPFWGARSRLMPASGSLGTVCVTRRALITMTTKVRARVLLQDKCARLILSCEKKKAGKQPYRISLGGYYDDT